MVNGKVRQEASAKLMMAKILDLITWASKMFAILPGDVLLTGAPAGVAQLKSGDRLKLELDEQYLFETSVQ